MRIFKTVDDNFLKLVLKVLAVLIVIQILRASVMGTLWFAVPHPINLTFFQFFNGLSFVIVGFTLLFFIKPSLNELGLDWNDIRIKTRIIYILGIMALIFLALSPYIMFWEVNLLITGVVSLIVSAFEELLFRGYIWDKVQRLEIQKRNVNSGVLTWVTVTLLFSIWHLGYLDAFLINPMGPGNLSMLLVSKIGIGLVLGFITGFLRLKTGKTYASFMFHGLWNVFAP